MPTSWAKSSTSVAPGNAGRSYLTPPRSAALGSQPAMPTFDDSDPVRYWSSANRLGSTQVAGVGVTMTVTGQSGYNLTVDVDNPES